MITTDLQYKVTKSHIKAFNKALKKYPAQPEANVHPLVHQAGKDAIEYQLNELRKEAKEYEDRQTSQ